MSEPSQRDHAPPSLDPSVGLMFLAADHLVPLFKVGSIDSGLARQMAISAIDAYQPESRADYVSVARTIAFSMAALALLGQAASQDMTMKDKMRTFGRANALNRSADQAERTMMQRRRYQKAAEPSHPGAPAANPQPTTSPPGGPGPDAVQADEAEVNAAIAGAVQEYLAACAPTPASPQPASTASGPKATMSDSARTRAAAGASAIHHPVPGASQGQPRPSPFKQELLRHSALHHVIGQGTPPRPASPPCQRQARQSHSQEGDDIRAPGQIV